MRALGLFATIALAATAHADGLRREPSGNVVMQSGATALRFFSNYGGAPNQWWREGFPLLTNDFPGSGVSVAWRTGQDPTQASANGPMENPIARIGDAASQRFNFYGRETVFDTRLGVYEVRGFAPDFWLSSEPLDDAIAPNADGSDTGWRTPYQPGRFSNLLASPSRPVVFEGSLPNQSGLFFVGSELDEGSAWSNRLRRYEQGRIAFKTRLSLFGAAPEAFAGFVLQKDIPSTATTKHDAWNADGLHLFFNRQGGWQIARAGGAVIKEGRLTNVQRALLEGPKGLQVEARTHNGRPGYLEVWLEDALVFTTNLGRGGPHFGLFASTPWGYVTFNSRAVFDVGVEFISRYSPWSGGVVSDIVVRSAPGADVLHAFDRANMPAVFLSQSTFAPADRQIARVFDDDGQNVAEPLEDGSRLLSENFGWWAGNSEGTAGVLGIPEIVTVDGRYSPGAHVFLKRSTENGEFVMMFNPFQGGVITEAREMRLRIRWSTSLHD